MSALTDLSLKDFIARTASDAPAPGGGSAAALAGSLAAALAAMVASLSQGEKYPAERMRGLGSEALSLSHLLEEAVQKDADSFDGYMAALRLPKGSPEEIAARRAAMQAGLQSAARVPLATAEAACRVFPLAAAAAAEGNPNARSDALVAAMLARAAVLGAVCNVRINLAGIQDEAFRKDAEARCAACVRTAAKGEAAVLRLSPLSADMPPAADK